MSDLPPDMKVRLSLELRRQVETAAKQNRRTLNAEISSRLEASFAAEGGEVVQLPVGASPLEERVKALEERLAEVEALTKKWAKPQL